MAFAPSPDSLVSAWEAAFPKHPNAERRKMFGYPAGFVNGNMFGGLWQTFVAVRLPEDDRDECVAEGAQPFEPTGRSMKEYVVLPDAIVRDRGKLRRWLELAFAYASELPPKVARVTAKKPGDGARASRTSPPSASKGPRKAAPPKSSSSTGIRKTSTAKPAAKKKA